MGKERRSLAVMMSRRANVFYLEHVRVFQKDGRLMYLTETGQPVEKIVNIPDKNTAFVLLGKGTSITDAAVRKLAESNIMLGFCGSGGSPLFGAIDVTFLVPQDEYRPTEYMQAWARLWFDETARLALAKEFLRQRIAWAAQHWPTLGVEVSPKILEEFEAAILLAGTAERLLSAEAHYAKAVYGYLAKLYGVDFSRQEGKRSKETPADRVNSNLDHGNYIAYGYSACALHVLGISYSFPVLHGKTRRGALVFDLADLVKDWLVMPAAFTHGAQNKPGNDFRAVVIKRAQDNSVLDLLITFIKTVIEKACLSNELDCMASAKVHAAKTP
ncbi:MAG: type I-F CRISPR-associated endonuclease Cas1 [Betaproteobacteria bacterium]|nr:type I-F CRISPR-associated endonuclease Cas1 [Betaproteobacteria bacterium]